MENYGTHDKKIKKHKAFHAYFTDSRCNQIYTRFASKWKIMKQMTKKTKNIKHSMSISQVPDINRYIHVLPQNGKLCNT